MKAIILLVALSVPGVLFAQDKQSDKRKKAEQSLKTILRKHTADMRDEMLADCAAEQYAATLSEENLQLVITALGNDQVETLPKKLADTLYSMAVECEFLVDMAYEASIETNTKKQNSAPPEPHVPLMRAWSGKYGYVVKKTKEVAIPYQYDYASEFSGGLAQVQLKGKNGFINSKGATVIPFHYEKVLGDFSKPIVGVMIDGKWGFIDRTGKVITPFQYTFAAGFSEEGLAHVRLNNKWGFIDTSGKEVIPCQYDYVYLFYDGLATVRLNGKYGFIDRAGNTVIPLQYTDASIFQNGKAKVSLGKKTFYIDKTGKKVKK